MQRALSDLLRNVCLDGAGEIWGMGVLHPSLGWRTFSETGLSCQRNSHCGLPKEVLDALHHSWGRP